MGMVLMRRQMMDSWDLMRWRKRLPQLIPPPSGNEQGNANRADEGDDLLLGLGDEPASTGNKSLGRI